MAKFEKPLILDVNPAGIPADLKAKAQWVCWKLEPQDNREKPAKPPVNPITGKNASVSDSSSWGTYDQAWAYYQQQQGAGIMGVGFVFTKGDPFVGIDLDHCRDPETGKIEPWALGIVGKLDSYTEISPSGTGLHIVVIGVLPPGKRKEGDVEMYDELRFLTITGVSHERY